MTITSQAAFCIFKGAATTFNNSHYFTMYNHLVEKIINFISE